MENSQMESCHRDVVLCNQCKGEGTVDERVGPEEYERIPCSSCGGHGRLIRIVEEYYAKMSNDYKR